MAYLGFVCSTPPKDCNGKPVPGAHCMYHSDYRSCLRCKENYLKSQGFVKVGTRMWKDPKDGMIMVLCKSPGKVSKARRGKEGRPMKEFHAIVQW